MKGLPTTPLALRCDFPTGPRRAGPGQLGLALIEIMIALALGLLIIAALIQFYASSKQSYVLSDALTRLDENGRFAVDFLTSDLRMAGYLSCGGAEARVGNSVNGAGSWLYQTGGIRGYEGGVGTPPAEFTGQFRAGTDILIVRRATLELERSVIQDDAANGRIKLGLDHGFQIGEILVIANPSCTQASLFQVTRLLNLENPEQTTQSDAVQYGLADDLSPGNCTRALFGAFDCSQAGNAESGVFRPGSVVSRFAVHAYYVTGTDPPTLARKTLSHANGQATVVTEELIRDVENFQILYGRDTVADSAHAVDDYVTANQVTDWNRVVSIRFALVVRSREPRIRSAPASLPYDMLGTTVNAAADQRLRRSFSGMVAVRNNLP